MSADSKEYRLIRRVKSDRFDIDEIQTYTLALQVGIRDFQLAVTGSDSNVLIIEDYRLDGVKTINSRIHVLKALFENHHILQAGFWNSICLSFKTHKFTLVPAGLYEPKSKQDYLAVNSEIKPSIEDVHSTHHQDSDIINIFVSDSRLLKWIKTLYPNKEVTVVHQGSALIEGILRNDVANPEKCVSCLIDRGILHVTVSVKKRLLYYNQFAARKSEDYLKYIMLVFKELDLDQKTTPVTLWGNLKPDSAHVKTLKKYIRHVSLGDRPRDLQFSYHFDEVLDHQYFDLVSLHWFG